MFKTVIHIYFKYMLRTFPVLSKQPLKTRPKPPSPNRHSDLKFFVAAASSRKVNVCAAIFAGGPSLGTAGSFFGSEPFRDFDLSVQISESDTLEKMKEGR